ncbi:hypothetical protein EB001_10965 [bacterium]|jgi:lysyl-tRNA synthetase class I|nr:hypothetical protein [bacterium]
MGLDNDDIKALIAILQKGLSNDIEEESSQPKKKTKSPKTKNAKTTKAVKENKFDDMPEARMHKEDTAIDKKLAKMAPVPRNRPYTPINIQCRVCGRQEAICPSLIESVDRYKCNKCSSSAG